MNGGIIATKRSTSLWRGAVAYPSFGRLAMPLTKVSYGSRAFLYPVVNYSVKPDEQSQACLSYAMAKNSLIVMNVGNRRGKYKNQRYEFYED